MKESVLDLGRSARPVEREADVATPPAPVDARIDLSGVRCPQTFVRTLVRLERLAPGGVLETTLTDPRGIEDLPASIARSGHEILGRRDGASATVFWIRRGETTWE